MKSKACALDSFSFSFLLGRRSADPILCKHCASASLRANQLWGSHGHVNRCYGFSSRCQRPSKFAYYVFEVIRYCTCDLEPFLGDTPRLTT